MSIGFISPLDAAVYAQGLTDQQDGPIYVIAETDPNGPTIYGVSSTALDTDTVVALVVSGGGVAWKDEANRTLWRRYWREGA